jgi:hypothetical protein
VDVRFTQTFLKINTVVAIKCHSKNWSVIPAGIFAASLITQKIKCEECKIFHQLQQINHCLI